MTSRSRISWRAGERHGRELAEAGHGGSRPDACLAPGPGGLKLFHSRSSTCPLGDTQGRQQGRPAQPLRGHPQRLGGRRGGAGGPSQPAQGITQAPTNHTVFHYVALKGNTLGPSGLLPSLTGLLFAARAGGHQPPAVQSPLQPRGCSSSGPPAPRPPCSSAPLLLRHPCFSASLLLGLPVLRFPARSAHRLYSPARGHSSFSTNNLLRLPSSTATCPIQCPLSGLQKKFSVILA